MGSFVNSETRHRPATKSRTRAGERLGSFVNSETRHSEDLQPNQFHFTFGEIYM